MVLLKTKWLGGDERILEDRGGKTGGCVGVDASNWAEVLSRKRSACHGGSGTGKVHCLLLNLRRGQKSALEMKGDESGMALGTKVARSSQLYGPSSSTESASLCGAGKFSFTPLAGWGRLCMCGPRGEKVFDRGVFRNTVREQGIIPAVGGKRG